MKKESFIYSTLTIGGSKEQLVIEALAFIRGRSLSETYCIIDEAQNLPRQYAFRTWNNACIKRSS